MLKAKCYEESDYDLLGVQKERGNIDRMGRGDKADAFAILKEQRIRKPAKKLAAHQIGLRAFFATLKAQ